MGKVGREEMWVEACVHVASVCLDKQTSPGVGGNESAGFVCVLIRMLGWKETPGGVHDKSPQLAFLTSV